MDNKEYNDYLLAYKFLFNIYDKDQYYSYDNYYRCYDIRRNNLGEVLINNLKKFKNLTFRHLYKTDYIVTHNFGATYLDSNIVVFKTNQICVLSELGHVFLYLLVSKLDNGIRQFKEILLELSVKHKNDFLLDEDNNRIIVDVHLLKSDYKIVFQKVNNYEHVVNLLGSTNSGLIMLNDNGSVVIDLHKINELLDYLGIFDFSKVNL